MRDSILIDQLELSARVGVTNEERQSPQRVVVTLRLEPTRDFSTLADCIENTIDYFQVCVAMQAIAGQSACSLIETLAEEIAGGLLEKFPLEWVELELRKFVLPDTAFVAVKIRRAKPQPKIGFVR